MLVYKFPDRLTFVNHVVACFFSILIMLTTMILNSLTFATLWWSPRLRKSTSLFLVMILSGLDAVSGLASNLLFTVRLAGEVFGTVECDIVFIQTTSNAVVTIMSLVTVTAINIERYIGVVHPMYHRTQLKKSTLFKFIILFWIFSGIVLVLSLIYGYRILLRFTTIMISGFMLFTMFAYTRIGIKVISSERQRKKFCPPSENDQCRRRKEQAHFLKEIKLAKSCFMIVICYVLCLTPLTVFLAILCEMLPDRYLIIAIAWCLNFALLNSSLNSVVFFWRSKQLRKETICFLKNMNIKPRIINGN